MKNELTISNNDNGRKLEKVVRKYFQDLSLGKIYKLFRKGEIKINKKRANKDDEVKTGDILTIYTKEEIQVSSGEKKEIQIPEKYFKENFHVIYEDDDILAVNKPAGIAVHPGSGHYYGKTMIDLAEYYIKVESGKLKVESNNFVQLAHRLDADTSGVLLFAKNGEALRNINDQMRRHETEKHYYALVFGKMPKNEGIIKTEIERIEGSKFNKIRIVSKKTSESKTSITEYKVKNTFHILPFTFSLLDINLQTGRMHQIRVHMKSQGNPLVMDQIYGDFEKNREFQKKYKLKRQFLHAYSMKLKHPKTGKDIIINAQLNTDLLNILNLIDQK